MNYLPLTDDNLETLTTLYVEYYNTHDDCCWTFDKACRKLHQMMTIEDSLCLVQCTDEGTITGLSLGYLWKTGHVCRQ